MMTVSPTPGSRIVWSFAEIPAEIPAAIIGSPGVCVPMTVPRVQFDGRTFDFINTPDSYEAIDIETGEIVILKDCI